MTFLVTDLVLPDQLNGREFTIMVKERWPKLPVILMSGRGLEAGDGLPWRFLSRKALECGADGNRRHAIYAMEPVDLVTHGPSRAIAPSL